jgi:transposase
MDNFGGRKGNAVRAAIHAGQAKLLFQPSYSADLNPIARVFAKLKTWTEKPLGGSPPLSNAHGKRA